MASISCTRRQKSALSTVSLRWTYRTSSGWHYNRRIWWLFKLKANFLSDPILDVTLLKSNHEAAERKLCSLCNHFWRAYQQGFASDTHSKRGASASRGDRMNAEADDLLVPAFVVFDPIPEACLEPVSNWFATSCTVNTVSCMLCALGCLAVWMF